MIKRFLDSLKKDGFGGTVYKLVSSLRCRLFHISFRRSGAYPRLRSDAEHVKSKQREIFVVSQIPSSAARFVEGFCRLGFNVRLLCREAGRPSLYAVSCSPLSEKSFVPGSFCVFADDLPEYEKFAVQAGCRTLYAELPGCSEDDELLRVCSALAGERTPVSEPFYNNISAVVLNYNNRDCIFRCIDSILENNSRYGCKVVVVDNQSSDGSYELLQQRDDILLCRNDRNGCSSGRNLGVSMVESEYIIFLDSDQWVQHENWLDPYIEIFKGDDTVGAAGWAGGWFNSRGYAYRVADSFPMGYMPPYGLWRDDIGYIGTGGMMLKRSLFEEIGGFDLFYDPTCYEDTDISLKVRHAGKSLAYCPWLGVGHKPHQTTNSGSDAHDLLIRSKGEYFVSKWKKLDPLLLSFKK